MTIVPAYSRDYKTAKEVKAAWAKGKDFTICDMFSKDDGRQINKQDFDNDASLRSVTIRYKRLTQICVISKR